MKISQEEIDAACKAWVNGGDQGDLCQLMEKAIRATLKVRRARKQFKRERQRKEKDGKKQYVIQTWRGKRIPDLSMEELETAKEYYSLETLANVKDVATYRQILCEIIERKEKDTHVSECVKGTVAFAEKFGKEDDKQVVESVKLPQIVKGCGVGNPFDNHLIRNQFTPNGLMSAQLETVAATSSKAPEWDGTFGVGEWEMRNGGKAYVRAVRLGSLDGDINGTMVSWPWNGKYLGTSPFDLIRPWPKATLTVLPLAEDEQ